MLIWCVWNIAVETWRVKVLDCCDGEIPFTFMICQGESNLIHARLLLLCFNCSIPFFTPLWSTMTSHIMILTFLCLVHFHFMIDLKSIVFTTVILCSYTAHLVVLILLGFSLSFFSENSVRSDCFQRSFHCFLIACLWHDQTWLICLMHVFRVIMEINLVYIRKDLIRISTSRTSEVH